MATIKDPEKAEKTAPEARDMTIGETAKAASVTARTIRFYETNGLMPRPQRDRGNDYRRYQTADVQRLCFIRRAQSLGFKLTEIRDLLVLHNGDQSDCNAVRMLAESQMRKTKERIADLQRLHRALQRIVTPCFTNSKRLGCPLLEALTDIGR